MQVPPSSAAASEAAAVTPLRAEQQARSREELNMLYKGTLYDGCEAEGGLGFPLLGLALAQAVTV